MTIFLKKFKGVISQVINDISKTNLVDNQKLIDTKLIMSLLCIQFNLWLQSETFAIKSFIENFNNLYSVGAGGEIYADSQILFHKSFDLADSLSNKFNLFSNETKETNRVDFNHSFKTD